uniref:Uncharacterized protein n=1 Tax=Mycena chlorophos TaxID=658473 RepID=A0ABQ0LAB4_MYCCL|nr:predicted protein [Mycena chlorophos]
MGQQQSRPAQQPRLSPSASTPARTQTNGHQASTTYPPSRPAQTEKPAKEAAKAARSWTGGDGIPKPVTCAGRYSPALEPPREFLHLDPARGLPFLRGDVQENPALRIGLHRNRRRGDVVPLVPLARKLHLDLELPVHSRVHQLAGWRVIDDLEHIWVAGLDRVDCEQDDANRNGGGDGDLWYPMWYNLVRHFFIWTLLAGFVLFPGTFTSLSESQQLSALGVTTGNIINVVKHVSLYVIAWVCTGIGAAGMLYMWFHWSANYIWLVNRVFMPGFMNSVAGVIGTLSSVLGAQAATLSIASTSTLVVTSATAGVCGLLTAFYMLVLIRGVKNQHDRQVGRQRAGRHGEGYTDISGQA